MLPQPPPGYIPIHEAYPKYASAKSGPGPELVLELIQDREIRVMDLNGTRWVHEEAFAEVMRRHQRANTSGGRRSVIITQASAMALIQACRTSFRNPTVRRLTALKFETIDGQTHRLSRTRLSIYLQLMGVKTEKRAARQNPSLVPKIFLEFHTQEQWMRAMMRADVRASVASRAASLGISVPEALADLLAPQAVIDAFANTTPAELLESRPRP